MQVSLVIKATKRDAIVFVFEAHEEITIAV
jgi:hypothetical protein